MNLKQLSEMPGLKPGDREHMQDYELCKIVSLTGNENTKYIDMSRPYEVRVLGFKYYCIDSDGTIVSILEAKKTDLIKDYFKGSTIHEESIDTCEKYRGKRITTAFYYAILKHRLSILSDYEHYIGTKRLWKSLSKMNDVVIKIFHNHKLIEVDYDLIKDPIGVWSGPEYLILATTNKIIENLENRLTLL